MSDERRPQLRAMPIALTIVAALAVSAVLIATIGRLAGFTQLTRTLRHGDDTWLLVCVGGQIVVFAGYAAAIRGALGFENGPRISRRSSVRVALGGFAATQLVAAGGVAGLGFTYWAIRQAGVAKREAIVRLIGLNTAVFLMLGLIGLASAISALVLGVAPLGMTLPWIIGVPLILAVARWFTRRDRVEHWAAAETGFVRRPLAVGVSAAWWVRRVVATRDRAVLVPAACYWLGDIASLWGAVHAYGSVSSAALPVAYSTGYLAQSLPIPFIATGGADAATTFALRAVGVPLDVALVSVIAHRVFAFWLPIVPGAVVAGRMLRHPSQVHLAAT